MTSDASGELVTTSVLLRIGGTDLSVADRRTRTTLWSWPLPILRVIRCDKEVFRVEASQQRSVLFCTPDAEAICTCITSRCQQLQPCTTCPMSAGGGGNWRRLGPTILLRPISRMDASSDDSCRQTTVPSTDYSSTGSSGSPTAIQLSDLFNRPTPQNVVKHTVFSISCANAGFAPLERSYDVLLSDGVAGEYATVPMMVDAVARAPPTDVAHHEAAPTREAAATARLAASEPAADAALNGAIYARVQHDLQ